MDPNNSPLILDPNKEGGISFGLESPTTAQIHSEAGQSVIAESLEGRGELNTTISMDADVIRPTDSGEHHPQKGRHKKESRKEKRKQHDPKDWDHFISSMASEGELTGQNRNNKGKSLEKGSSQGAERGVEGWKFGKKLGLLSREGDEIMEKIIRGEQLTGESLGAKKKHF